MSYWKLHEDDTIFFLLVGLFWVFLFLFFLESLRERELSRRCKEAKIECCTEQEGSHRHCGHVSTACILCTGELP